MCWFFYYLFIYFLRPFKNILSLNNETFQKGQIFISFLYCIGCKKLKIKSYFGTIIIVIKKKKKYTKISFR